METVKLFEQDSYIREFNASVTECTPRGDNYRAVLDKTAFFPEGGGQRSDTGFLGCARVIDVQKEDGIIYHELDRQLEVGSQVRGVIDWGIRFERMQIHSGEHLLSGIIYSEFGFSNVGFHMGHGVTTFDCDGRLTQEDVDRIENLANEAVYADVAIDSFYLSDENRIGLNVRAKIPLDNGIRVVRIDGYDCCACCAPHVSRTGEIGIIKILNFYSYKGGTRFEIVCGRKAFEDYRVKDKNNSRIMRLFSLDCSESYGAVEKCVGSLSAAKAEIHNLKNRLAFAETVTEISGNALLGINGEIGCGYDELRYCCNIYLARENIGKCLLFARAEEGYIYVVGSRENDATGIIAEINGKLNGHGGGRAEFGQGKVSSRDEEIRVFFRTLQ